MYSFFKGLDNERTSEATFTYSVGNSPEKGSQPVKFARGVISSAHITSIKRTYPAARSGEPSRTTDTRIREPGTGGREVNNEQAEATKASTPEQLEKTRADLRRSRGDKFGIALAEVGLTNDDGVLISGKYLDMLIRVSLFAKRSKWPGWVINDRWPRRLANVDF